MLKVFLQLKIFYFIAQHKHFRTKTTSTSMNYLKSDYIKIYFIKINHIERIIMLYQNILEGLIVLN